MPVKPAWRRRSDRTRQPASPALPQFQPDAAAPGRYAHSVNPLALALLPALMSATAPPGKTTGATSPQLAERLLVLVFPPATQHPPRGLAPAIEAALRAAGLDVVDVGALFPTAEAGETEGAKLVTAGKAAYDNLDIEPAGELFEKALDWYTANPTSGTSAALAEVHMLLAAVALQDTSKQGAKRAIAEVERALLRAPELTLPEQYFGTEGPRLLAKARAAVAASGKGRLSVQSTPPALATVGAKEVEGATDVPRGRHLVEFTLRAYLPKAVFVDVGVRGAMASAALTPAPGYAKVLDALAPLVPSSFDGAALPAAAGEAGRAVDARFLVLVSADNRTGVLEVWDLRAGDRLTGVELPPGTLPTPTTAALAPLAEKVKTFVRRPSAIAAAGARSGASAGGEVKGGTGDGTVGHVGGPPASGTSTSPEPSGSPRASGKWWVWAAAGGAAVVGAVAVGAAVASSGRGRAFDPVLGF